MRLRRSLFFVAPATPAGRPSRRKPGETVKALAGRPGRAGSGLPKAAAPEARSCCRKQPHGMRGRYGRTTFGPGASRARLSRKSCVCMAVRFAMGAQGSHHQKPPPGPPRPPTSHGFPARVRAAMRGNLVAQSLFPCSLLFTIVHYCSGGGGGSKCPRTVSRSRSDITTERRSRQLPSPSGLLPLRRTQNEPMLRKGSVL